MTEIIEGYDVDGIHIDANLEVSWYKWLDPENQDISLYRKWEYLTPPAVVLNAEFRSWRASYVDEAAAQSDWQWIHDNLLQYMYEYQTGAKGAERVDGKTNVSNVAIFQLTLLMQSDNDGAYSNIFYTSTTGSMYQLISSIMYDYNNHQRNRLVQYLCPEYPDQESFYLQPSDYGVALYNENDIRGLTQKWRMNTLGGKRCVSKYYYG